MTEWVTSSVPYLAPRDGSAGDPWKEEAARAGRVGGHRLVLVETRTPPERVSALLGGAPGTAAVLRRRIVTLDDVPVEVSDSWYPASIAAGTALAEQRPIKGGALRTLAELGYVGARHVEEVAVIDTPPALLELLRDTPVIELTRVSYAESDVPFEVAVMVMVREMGPGMPRRLRYEMRTA